MHGHYTNKLYKSTCPFSATTTECCLPHHKAEASNYLWIVLFFFVLGGHNKWLQQHFHFGSNYYGCAENKRTFYFVEKKKVYIVS